MKVLSKSENDYVELKVPGKILLCGGYSILYEQGLGISLSIDRAYSFKAYFNNQQCSYVINNSFKDQNIEFDIENYQNIQNVFVRSFAKVQYLFLKATKQDYRGINYEIIVDEGFYQNTKQKNNKEYYLSQLKKSGLGSSSCFQVGLIGCFYYLYYKILDKQIIYLLSLILNAYAQNKIGSGFDICTAVFGSCFFQRIPIKKIRQFMEQLESQKIQYLQNFSCEIIQVNQNFQSFRYYFIDFCIGFKSTTSSKHFMNCKSNENHIFVKKLNEVLKELISSVQWKNEKQLKSVCFKHRNILQKASIQKNIPIEPYEYSYLFDTLLYLSKNILYCVAPGAGGYDGFVIITNQQIQNIQKILDQAQQIIYNSYQKVQKTLSENYNYVNLYNQQKKTTDPKIFNNLQITELSLFQLILCNNGTLINYQL